MILAKDAAYHQHDETMKKGPQGNGPALQIITCAIKGPGDSRHKGTETGAARLGKRRVGKIDQFRLRHQGIKIGLSQPECDVAFTGGLQIVPAVRMCAVKRLGGLGEALRRKCGKKRALVGKVSGRRCVRDADPLCGLAQGYRIQPAGPELFPADAQQFHPQVAMMIRGRRSRLRTRCRH